MPLGWFSKMPFQGPNQANFELFILLYQLLGFARPPLQLDPPYAEIPD